MTDNSVTDVKVFGEGKHPGPSDKDDQRVTDVKLAELLDALANGDTVRLGEFSKAGGEGADLTWTDVLAGQLGELAFALRENRVQI